MAYSLGKYRGDAQPGFSAGYAYIIQPGKI